MIGGKVSFLDRLWMRVDDYFSQNEREKIKLLSMQLDSERGKLKKMTNKVNEGLEANARLNIVIEEQELKIEQLEHELDLLQPSKIKPPKTSGHMSMKTLKNLLAPHAENIFLSDTSYKLVIKQSMQDFLAQDKTNLYKWITTYFDCDEYSYRLMGQSSTPEWGGIAFGIAWSKSHAFNIFVDSKKQAYLIEPQTDRIMKIEHAQGAYDNLDLVII